MTNDTNDTETPQNIAIPDEVVLDAMNESNGSLCWRYMGLGRGWHARYNPETKHYEVAISANVPERTGDGDIVVKVETKQHWQLGRLDLKGWFPEQFTSGRLQPVSVEKTPFLDLDDPDDAPKKVIELGE